jgi:hypothetical protein
MVEIEINDIRDKPKFRSTTFSKFKIQDVRKELIKCLIESTIEPACYWSAELICSGHYEELVDILLYFYSKYIHIGNPKLTLYLELRINNLKAFVNNSNHDMLSLRNNNKVRTIFAEMVCVLCEAKRKHGLNEINVKPDDFVFTNITARCKAPNLCFAEEILYQEDPQELYTSLNELAFHISNGNTLDACYWIEWIMKYEHMCKLRKEKCIGEQRMVNVQLKYQTDIIWIIWDVFLYEAKKRNKILQKIINSLLNVFTLNYNQGTFKRRKFVLYFVVSLLTENANLLEDILSPKQKESILQVSNHIDCVYKQIKQNEICALFDSSTPNKDCSPNLKKTLDHMNMINTFEEDFIPRNGI